MDEKKKDCGAMWWHTSQKGTRYLSGNIEIDGKKHQIVMFENSYKEQEKHPDYKIYPSTPRGDQVSDQAETVAKVFQDDIPF